MKVAITFFGKKRKKEKYKNIMKNNKYVDILNTSVIKLKNYEILLMFFIAVILVMNINSIMYIATNIVQMQGINVTKEKIIAFNNMGNMNNYIFSPQEEKHEEKKIEPELLAMDNMAQEYNEQTVFNNINKEDIQVVAETEIYQKLRVCGIDITNYSTNRNIDFESILNSDDIFFSKSLDEILLYTTHTSESYANSEKYHFDYTSPRRSVDGNYNMLAIASTFASNLNDKGINTICSLTPHDYGEYNSAYSNSRRTMTELVESDPNISMLIDVHRDAIEDLEFAPKVNLKGYDVSGLMLVMGIGYDDEENPYYQRNLKLALQIQLLANKIYPGLFRPMIIRNSIYNQDIKENSFLVEVGASGNTIDEAMLATRCLANLINILYKD